MSNGIDSIVQKITEEIIAFLEEEINDFEIMNALTPIIPSLVDLAIKEGEVVAMDVVRGISKEGSYDHWKKLIEASSPSNRIVIMEQSRQLAVIDAFNKADLDERKKQLIQDVIKVLLRIVPALLL